jgi:branched-chain amino acid transport system substrate-binding protein
VAVAACGSSSSTSSSGEAGGPPQTITLGQNAELTGGGAVVGNGWKAGVQLAIDRINGDGGITVNGQKYIFAVDIQDNQTKPDQAISIDQGFLAKGYKFFLGPGVSTIFTPTFATLKGKTVLQLTPATTAIPLLGTPDGANLFDTHVGEDGAQGRSVLYAKFLIQKYHPATVALLLPQDGPGELYEKLMKREFTNAGVNVVYDDFFPGTQRDFSSYIAKMQSKSPDLVFGGGTLDSQGNPFMMQAAQAGFTSPVFAGPPGLSTPSIKGVENQIKTFVFSVTTRAVNNEKDAQLADFRTFYASKIGSQPDSAAFWTLSFYDPVQILAAAMVKAGTVTDIPKITAAMTQITSYPHPALNERFDSLHQAVYTPQFGVATNGQVSYFDAPSS